MKTKVSNTRRWSRPEIYRFRELGLGGTAKAKQDETYRLVSHREQGGQVCTWYLWIMSVPTGLTYVAVW